MSDLEFMARAVQLARRGLYTTRQNPRVGCVIVNNNKIVGKGAHLTPGGPHAEIYALDMAGDKAAGSDCYVTLEPCCHQGKTPPCTDALIKAGVRRVIVAMLDPNPAVAGQGLQQLREAGIEVVEGVLEDTANGLNPGFIKRMTQGLPLLRVKMAMSLDGRTAMASGESQWITGSEARADVHRWRARSCAILTGMGTVIADDPSLTCRTEEHTSLQAEIPENTPQPLRVVCDSALRISPDARLLSQSGKTLIVTTQGQESGSAAESLVQAGAEVAGLLQKAGKVSLEAVLRELAQREINEILVEAGPGMVGALLSEQLVDELLIYMAPHLMGDQARGLISIPGLDKMSDRISLEIDDIRAVGKDWRIMARPIYH